MSQVRDLRQWNCVLPKAIALRDQQLFQSLKQREQFLVGDGLFIRFIVNGEQVHGLFGHQHISNYPSPTRFAFPFRGDRQAYLVAVSANARALFGVFL